MKIQSSGMSQAPSLAYRKETLFSLKHVQDLFILPRWRDRLFISSELSIAAFSSAPAQSA